MRPFFSKEVLVNTLLLASLTDLYRSCYISPVHEACKTVVLLGVVVVGWLVSWLILKYQVLNPGHYAQQANA